MKMVDKRAHVRVHPAAGSQVVNTMTDQTLGRVVDISVNGFLLICREQIKPGKIFQLMLQLKELDGQSITLGAECIWSDHQESGLTFAGFQIIDIADSESKLLNTLIEQLTVD